MFFKSLEIQGFKSFADKTVLHFDTKTTAVVGSNGNGKSNISDALRWVMGEQGAKTLRGEKMEDVIFHGTVERKPMGFAKVALTIDNTDRALGVDADEVVISRKLYRSGESEYLINGQKSRLKDIQELLMGTGLGRDGYSIIGQGRVAEIVNARGTQRREIFEEAAGVSLFLHKKQEAEKQLASAEENITRQKDILAVDEKRLPKLKEQSEKAVLAAELMAEKKELDISVSTARLAEKSGSLKSLDDDILKNKAQCEHFEHDAARIESQIEQSANERMRIQAEVDRYRRSREAAKDEIAEIQAQIKVLEAKLESNEERRQELNKQLRDAQENGAGFDKEISDANEVIKAKTVAVEKLTAEHSGKQEELTSITRSNEQADKAYSDIEKRLAEQFRTRSEENFKQLQAKRAVESAEEKKRIFLQDMGNSEEKLAEYKKSRSEAEHSLEGIDGKRGEMKNRLAGFERLTGGKKKRRDEAKQSLDELMKELTDCQSRCKVLEDFEKSMGSYYRSVKEIIQASNRGELSGIHGIVADVITMDKRYVTAIETVLSSSVMQYIIVDNEETAKRCIRFLQSRDAGRATMLPLTAIKGRTLNEPSLESEEGFEGIASDLVRYDDVYGEIVRSLLGTTVIVDDIDTASYIGKKYHNKFRIVTLDGQLVNAGGSYTGGSTSKSSGLISRKQDIEELHTRIKSLSAKRKELEEQYRQYHEEVEKYSIEMDGMSDELRALDNDEIRLKAEISRLDSLILQLSDQDKTAKLTIMSYDSEIKQQQAIVEESTKAIEVCDKAIEELNARLTASGSERDDIAQHIREISAELDELSRLINAANNEIAIQQNNIRNFEENRRMLLKNSGEFQETMSRLDTSDSETRVEIERLRAEASTRSENISEHEGDIEASQKLVNELEMKIESLRRDVSEINRSKEKYTGEAARLDERRAAMQRDYDTIVKQLFDRYELTVSQATEIAKPVENLMLAENDLAELNRRISALGSVNMDSIEEYQQVSERYAFQMEQLADIEKSKRELEQLIERLTGDIKTRFLNSFEEINRYFKEIFVSIFGKGAHAELELMDPDDVLNSGIEIKAAPPGKVIKNLISLSGGEQAMVAITIYLAILKHRPTPFCMLDEVDAPLDDVNVEKYITYLNQFSNQTQLMVITHRRGTIEGCAVLYGVFMQEKGVSRLLRKELTDDLDVELN